MEGMEQQAGREEKASGAGFAVDLVNGRMLTSTCYTANLFDSFGDGWNGNVLKIKTSGLG